MKKQNPTDNHANSHLATNTNSDQPLNIINNLFSSLLRHLSGLNLTYNLLHRILRSRPLGRANCRRIWIRQRRQRQQAIVGKQAAGFGRTSPKIAHETKVNDPWIAKTQNCSHTERQRQFRNRRGTDWLCDH